MAATLNDNAPPSAAAAALSPRSSSGDELGSTQAPPRRTPSNSSPPWNQVVRGPEAEVFVAPPAPSPESSVTAVVLSAATLVEERDSVQSKAESASEGFECETQQEGSESGNDNASKKPAWNKPSNGAPEIGPVMGAVSWPSLSESTKASPKSPATDFSKNPSDAPVSVPLVTSTLALSSSGPQRHQRQMTSNASNPNPSATQHHGRPARQKSMKREGGGSSSSNGGFSHQPPQSSLVGESSHDSNSSVKTGFGGSDEFGGSDSSGRDHGHNNAYREGGQRGGGDHSQHRNYRRSNSGPHLRGDGSFGNKRDHDRGNRDWNHNRSFNGRDNVVPPQRVGPRVFITPPLGSPYIPPPIRPYTNPMSMRPEMQPLYYFAPHPGMPFVAQMPPTFHFPSFDHQLNDKIVKQIDYYFSNENLIKDTFLRRNMDEHGWVPLQLIASFKKVIQLTTNIQLILDAIRASSVVELQGDKIRKREDWMRWIMPQSIQFPTTSSSQSPQMTSQDTLVARMQGLAIDEKSSNLSNSRGQLDIHAGTLLKSSSGDVNLHSEISKDGSSSNGC